ncbi:DUF397 domain-containing protein [Actinomadura oligospora]|uniref:DUF397 domain-containing protein n=1 Tax=Actinomadura oligospora TaxID=111804 RepID=UPI00047C15FC|nr:DUF397 domain-containing protein [Actinomadura oligospora]
MINWRKSSYSGGGGSGGQECVEVARISRTVGMRDSKSPTTGHLSLETASFAVLLSCLKREDVTG